MNQHLFHGLTGQGFDVVCMEAQQANAAMSALRNNTDRNDARGIAHVLRAFWFSPVHMKSQEAHGVRVLLSAGKAQLNKIIDLANELRELLKIIGIRLPTVVQHGSFDVLDRPMIEMDAILANALTPLLGPRLIRYQQLLDLHRRFKRAASHDEVCLRLMSVCLLYPVAMISSVRLRPCLDRKRPGSFRRDFR